MQMVGHHFHLDEVISVGIADLLNGLFDNILYLIFCHFVAILRTENYMIVDVVDTVVCSSMHDSIITYVLVFEKNDRPKGDQSFHPKGQTW
jgi:hypothetical protein